MGRRDRTSNAAHIKSNTAGTSNEISFSVLEARRSRLDEQGDGQEEPSSFGRIELFSLPKRMARARNKKVKSQGRQAASPAPAGPSEGVSAVRPPDLEQEASPVQGAQGAQGQDAQGQGAPPAQDEGGTGADAQGRDQDAAAAQPGPARAHVAPAPAGRTAHGAGGAGSGFAEGVVVPAWDIDAAQEIERRKKNRRRVRRGVRIAVAAVVVALLGVGGVSLYGLYNHNLTGHGQLEDAADLLEKTDAVVDAMETAVSDPFDEDAADARTGAQASLATARERLDEAAALSASAQGELLTDEGREAAEQAELAVEARLEMLSVGEELMSIGDAAQESLDALNEAWACLVESASLVDEAAELVAQGDDESIEESTEKTEQARALVDEAQFLFSAAADSFSVDVEAYQSYVQACQTALDCAIASNDALLDDDVDEALAQNEAYAVADEEAAELGALLPDDPLETVQQAYDEAVEQLEEDYDDARTRAGAANAFLFDYLGR